MNAQVITFPRKKKRGRKVASGPVASMTAIGRPSPRPQVDRSLVDELEKRLAGHLDTAFRKSRNEEEKAFCRWSSGQRVSTEDFVAASHHGIATDTFGDGPGMFRWAVASTRKQDLLKDSDRDEALRLAVEQLNQIGLLVRLGGGFAYRSDEGDFGRFATADLGRTLRRLAVFGCVSSPTAAEREILDESKAKFDADGR